MGKSLFFLVAVASTARALVMVLVVPSPDQEASCRHTWHNKGGVRVGFDFGSVRWTLLTIIVGLLLVSAAVFVGVQARLTPTITPFPPDLLNIDSRFVKYCSRYPVLSEENARTSLVGFERGGDNVMECASRVVDLAGRFELNGTTGVNAAMHALMAFGGAHPVRMSESKVVSVQDFLQSYFLHLPPEVLPFSPPWIRNFHGDYIVATGIQRHFIEDHFSQLMAYCALAAVPLEAEFQLKSGEVVPLKRVLESEMRYCDPARRDPIWQTIAVTHYAPHEAWRNVDGKRLRAIDFLGPTLSRIQTSGVCGHTHPLISVAYGVRALEKAGVKESEDVSHLTEVKFELDRWVRVVRDTLCTDGSVSSRWYEGISQSPLSSMDVVILNGHTLEWLSAYLDKKELRDGWVEKIGYRTAVAVFEVLSASLAESELDHFDYPALCHAARALDTYRGKMSR